MAQGLILQLARTLDPEIKNATGYTVDGTAIRFTAYTENGREKRLCLETDGTPVLSDCCDSHGIPSDGDGIPLLDELRITLTGEEFLTAHYPEALFQPIPVPIWSILTGRMGLRIDDTYNLTRDFSILGRLCICDTELTVYRHDGIRKEEHIHAEKDTIFIDSRLRAFRSEALSVTLAHEAAHWLWHRAYFRLCQLLNILPTDSRPEAQAEQLADAILLPECTFLPKAVSLPRRSRVRCLSSFYSVPPQVIERRLNRPGFHAMPEDEPPLSAREVFGEYLRSEAFRSAVDSGALRSAESVTFWQKLWQYIRLRNMNSAVFAEKTLLDESYFRHAEKNDGKALPEVRTVVAMCIGLGLDLTQSQELLRLAGRALNDSREHIAYSYVLSMLRGQSIHECNTFLAEIGIRTLGAKGGM